MTNESETTARLWCPWLSQNGPLKDQFEDMMKKINDERKTAQPQESAK